MDNNQIKNTFFKLYGLDHSGSHYLSWLLHNNYKDVVILHSHTGWNHGPIVTELNWDSSTWNRDRYIHPNKQIHGRKLQFEKLNSGLSVLDYKSQLTELYKSKELNIVCLIRDPYNWLNSFLITHYISYKTIHMACKQWNDTTLNYFNNDWKNTYIIKYETLRDFPKDVINHIGISSNLSEIVHFQNTNEDHAKGGIFKKTDITKEICIKRISRIFDKSEDEVCHIIDNTISDESLNYYKTL